MLCIGPGPGPKNVLALLPDGSKVVYPYAIWKHKVSQGVIPEAPRWSLGGGRT